MRCSTYIDAIAELMGGKGFPAWQRFSQNVRSSAANVWDEFLNICASTQLEADRHLIMEHTTVNGETIDWNILDTTYYDPFRPDCFHHSDTEVKSFAASWSAGVQHASTLPNIEQDFMARGAVLEALLNCRHPPYATTYYLETLWAAMAPFVFRISHIEDSFQKGMTAIWEELPKWVEKYPIDHTPTGPDLKPFDSVLDVVVKYLCGVAKNAMSGRKRKPTLFDSSLVDQSQSRDSVIYNVEKVIEELTTKPEERHILRLKSQKFSEAQIGAQIGLSRDQVKRKIKRLYQSCCERYGLDVKPMGRSKRKPA